MRDSRGEFGLNELAGTLRELEVLPLVKFGNARAA